MDILIDTLMIGTWWRAASYEVREGRVTPTKGAAITEFNPWAEYKPVIQKTVTNQDDKSSAPRPYLRLVDLIESLRSIDPEGDTLALDGESKERICEWCSENGLLGLLPHEVREAVVPHERGRHQLARLIRTTDGWVRRPVAARRVPNRSHVEGGVARPAYRVYEEPVVFRERLGREGTEAEELGDTWAVYSGPPQGEGSRLR